MHHRTLSTARGAHRALVRCCVLTLGLVNPVAAQQSRAVGAQSVIMISVESRKPFVNSAYASNSEAWADAYRAAGGKMGWYAMDGMTGEQQSWYLVGAGSFAELEQMQNEDRKLAMSDKVSLFSGRAQSQVNSIQDSYGRLISDWSVNEEKIDWAKSRYVQVLTYHIRPGHRGDFSQALKKVATAYQKVPRETHFAVYEMVAGASEVTFQILIPMRSLADLDPDADVQRAYFNNIGGMDGLMSLEKLAAASVESGHSEIYRVNPKASVVSSDFATADPEFWSTKRASPAPASKKKGTR